MHVLCVGVGREITASNVGVVVDFTKTIVARVSALIIIAKTISKSVKV